MSRSMKVRRPAASEMRELRQILAKSPQSRFRRWAEILLLYGAGLAIFAIAVALSVHVNTVYVCLHRFARKGLLLFQRAPRQGVPPRITAGQLNRIARIAEQAPTAFGWPYGRWSLAKLQTFLIHDRRLLKTISREHLRRLLKKRIFAYGVFNAN